MSVIHSVAYDDIPGSPCVNCKECLPKCIIHLVSAGDILACPCVNDEVYFA